MTNTTTITYEIQTLRDGVWTADGLGDDNQFTTEAEAQDGIAALQALGDEWATAQYRVAAR